MLNRLFGGRRPPRYLAHAEFWVYVAEPAAPKQDDVMSRMVQANPYGSGGSVPIGPREGILWSDIRFHMALVLRQKNTHLFRPDLFDAHVEPTADQLTALANSEAFVKLSYVSEQPLSDRRHLQFLTYATESVAELAGASVVFDTVAEKLFHTRDLQDLLHQDSNASRKEIHLRAIWRPCPLGGTAETRGLRKIGLPELCTPETMSDHSTLARQVLELAADRIWEEGEIASRLTLEHMGDRYHVVSDPSRSGPCRAQILRENA